jgi:hypothetical protein
MLRHILSGCLGSLLAAALSAPAGAAVRVGFNQPVYSIGPGATFPVVITIDGNDATPLVLDPVPNGLFAYSLEMTITPSSAATVQSVSVVPPLNFSGVSSQAMVLPAVLPASGSITITGNVQLGIPVVDYTGTTIATIFMTDAPPANASYNLALAIHEIGPPASFDSFVDGSGNVLDGNIVFGTAQVNVTTVPPTSVPALSRLGVVTLSVLLFSAMAVAVVNRGAA